MTNNERTSSASADAKRGSESTQSFPDARACFSELMGNVNLFAVMINSSAEIIYCNSYFVQMTGVSVEEVMGRGWGQIFGSTWAAEFGTDFSDWLKDEPDALHHDSDLMPRAGEPYRVRWNTIPLRDPLGALVGAASIGEDITERRQLERALLDSSARERRNLEAELHDGLGQELFGLALQARGLADSAKRDKETIAADLEYLAVGLNHAIDTCRGIARGFSPIGDLQGGLIDALRNLTTTPKGWLGPTLEFSLVQAAPLKLPAETLDHIYRLAQEGLTNALRHADANSIKIILNIQPSALSLEVLDDGVGLTQSESPTGTGLKLMRYRANILRAYVRVAMGPTRGTRLFFRIDQ
jgi:PAS domain S-box-containing protein